jgi:hypothetical protein
MRWASSITLLASLAASSAGCSSSKDTMSQAGSGGSGAGGTPSSQAGAGGNTAATGGTSPAAGPAGASGSTTLSSGGASAGGAPPGGTGASGGASGTPGNGGTAGSGNAGAAGSGTGDAGPLVVPVPLPDGTPGIGFDDLVYSPALKKVVAPAGRTGDVDLVDPMTLEVTRIGGFSKTTMFTLGKHRSGSTAADVDDAGSKIYAIDNETKTLRVVDPATKMTTFTSMLAAPPDYVRWIKTTNEVWVSGPNNPGVMASANPGIEVFTLSPGAAPVHAALIPISNGPEGLAIDNMRKRLYTDSFQGQTYSVDVEKRTVVATWPNGCPGLTVDLQVDEARGFVMVPCANPGKVVVLDAGNGGKKLGELSTGAGVDVCAYNPTLHHFYMAGQTSADLSIVGVSAAGVPTLLGKIPTAMGSQMVAADEFGNAWVGDPGGGRLLKIRDTYPATQ